MKLPKFNAEASLGRPSRTYRGKYQFGCGDSRSQSGIPSVIIPNQMDDAAEEEELTFTEQDVDIEEEEENGEGALPHT